MCKSLYTYLTVCFAFEKPRWLLHNTADRAETVFSHLKLPIIQNSDILPLFFTPTWLSHHVREKQELF